MAKKRKKDKGPQEEYEFKPPEFDEKEFLLKELRDTKTVLFTVGYAALFGAVAGLISIMDESLVIIGLVLVFGGLFSLKYFYSIVSIDTSQFLKKNWAGNIAWFFFTFLAIWVLTFNFPISDHAKPVIEDVTIWVDDGETITAIDWKYVDAQGSYQWVPREDVPLNSIIRADENYTVNITARITDNGNLLYARIQLYETGPFINMTAEGDHRFGFSLNGSLLSDSLFFVIIAADDQNHEEPFESMSIPVAS